MDKIVREYLQKLFADYNYEVIAYVVPLRKEGKDLRYIGKDGILHSTLPDSDEEEIAYWIQHKTYEKIKYKILSYITKQNDNICSILNPFEITFNTIYGNDIFFSRNEDELLEILESIFASYNMADMVSRYRNTSYSLDSLMTKYVMYSKYSEKNNKNYEMENTKY